MSDELKRIKRYYGETMAHFCRTNFSSILENQGKLLEILTCNFNPTKYLYDDLDKFGLLPEFKKYIYSKIHLKSQDDINNINLTPSELLNQAGYDLYECKTESDIAKFIGYYKWDEELCTFKGGRLETCYVFFAVKKNIDSIKREDFLEPKREDLYGTSVMSIQFTRDASHTLSIKNRYNHSVPNPDATYSNDLDKIIPGLTASFSKYYGLKQANNSVNFGIPGYIIGSDGRSYKYNYEINKVYYCPDNIIINEKNIQKLEKEKYIIMDYFVLDLVNKRIINNIKYLSKYSDAFIKLIGNIKKINVINNGSLKTITIINDLEEVTEIVLDKQNNIKGIKNNYVTEIGSYFLFKSKNIKSITLNNVQVIGSYFLNDAFSLDSLDLPNLEIIGNDFLLRNKYLSSIDLPKIKCIGDNFIANNNIINAVNLPLLEKVGNAFLGFNNELINLHLPSLVSTGNTFLYFNKTLKELYVPNLKNTGILFLPSNANNLYDTGTKFIKC